MQIFDVIIFFELRTIRQNSETNLSLSVWCQEAGRRKRARDCPDEKWVFSNAINVFFYVRLLVFFSGYSSFPIHPLGCLELDFGSSFSKVGLYLGRIVYFSCIIYNSVSSRFIPLFPRPPPLFFYILFLTYSNYCVILLTSRPSPFLV